MKRDGKMYHNPMETKAKIVKERKRAAKIGKILWVCILIIGILGWVFWKWYSILIAFLLAVVGSSVYSYLISKKIQRISGLDIHEQESTFYSSNNNRD